MALANIAELFYQAGLKVLIIDWDLEAPGLERFFPFKHETVTDHLGLMDMLLVLPGASSQAVIKPPKGDLCKSI